VEGNGPAAERGDEVVYNLRIYLNGGDEVPLNERQAEHLPEHMIRTVHGYRYIDHRTTLGRRRPIAGIEYSLVGMKPAGIARFA
jgi:hypothetical protein